MLELLIYIAILSGLMVVVSNAFISISKGRGQAEARNEVNAAVRFATEKLRQDLKDASSVSTPTLGTPSATLVMTIAGATTTYDVSAGVLRRTVGAGSPIAVTGTNIFVNAPTFTLLQNTNSVLSATTTAVQINLTFKYNVTNTDWTYSTTIQTTASLR